MPSWLSMSRLQPRRVNPTDSTDRQNNPSQFPRRSPIYPRGRSAQKGAKWPQSPLHMQRNDALDKITWSSDAQGIDGRRNPTRAYEFRWTDTPEQHHCDMYEFGPGHGELSDEDFEFALNEWLVETRVNAPTKIRLLICHAINLMDGSLPLSRKAFEMIEESFSLHPTTVPAIWSCGQASLQFIWPGRQEGSPSVGSIWIVASPPCVSGDVTVVLSLRYNNETRRTDAIIFTSEKPTTAEGYSYVEKMIDALLASYRSWEHPRVLSETFLQTYIEFLMADIDSRDGDILDIERGLGATRTWEESVDGDTTSSDWPRNIEVRINTTELHAAMCSLANDRSGLLWIEQFHQSFTEANHMFDSTEAAIRGVASSPDVGNEAGDMASFVVLTSGLLQSAGAEVERISERAQIQADLLFSIVSQKDSLESISVAQSAFVFTFISALFLPCTLVASIFSMSMFNWQPGSGSSSVSSYVSNRFWIYWAFSLPLTILVMGGWYWWSKQGMQIWQRSHSRVGEKPTSWRAKSRWLRFLGRKPRSTRSIGSYSSGSVHSRD